MGALIGRPSLYSDELAERVCEHVAAGGSIVDLCDENAAMPTWRTVYGWMAKHDTFFQAHARAKLAQMQLRADEIIPLADDESLKPEDRKVRVAARQWLLAKLVPATYGDKLDVTSKGEALAAPSHQVDARVQSIVMQAAMRMQGALPDEVAGLLD